MGRKEARRERRARVGAEAGAEERGGRRGGELQSAGVTSCRHGSVASLCCSVCVCEMLFKKSFYSFLIRELGEGVLGRAEGALKGWRATQALDSAAKQAVALGQRGKDCLQRGLLWNPELCA